MNWVTAMTDKETQGYDDALEGLFETARRTTLVPDAEFLAKLAADMESMVPDPRRIPSTQADKPGFFMKFRGFFAASGLTGAAALGVWIGFVMPEALNTLAAGYDTSEPFGIGAFLPAADLAALEE